MKYLVFFLCISKVLSIDKNPSVIVVGAGASGIAATAKLLENGFKDVTILEAEDRIGGRINSTKFHEYSIDLGGQWVYGEKGNVVYDLAWPLGLLSHSKNPETEPVPMNITVKFYGSAGGKTAKNISQGFFILMKNVTTEWKNLETMKTGSVGEYIDHVLDQFIAAYTKISGSLREPLMSLMHLAHMPNDGGYDWNKVSAKSAKEYHICEGNPHINWKQRTYSTILDILMKKYPKPDQELPILKKTLLNTKVRKIDYGSGLVKVTTSDGKEFKADHVVFTPSLGVLQANYKNLFEPKLSDKKVNSVSNLEISHSGKIYLYYDEPWWKTGEDIYAKLIYWMPNDSNEIKNNVEKRWMLSVRTVVQVEYKPQLLCILLNGPNVKEMEKLPEDVVRSQIVWLLNQFFSDSYNVTEPSGLIRSYWNSNENFLGSYSYRSVVSDKVQASAEDLGAPILQNGKPVVLFAGEATAPRHYGTVHGAIESGWREADRLINFYK